jgi:hypothetical protein
MPLRGHGAALNRVVQPEISGQNPPMESCPLKQNVGGFERLACLAAGGLIFAKGVLTRRTSRTVLGGLLIYRGLSGNCKAYEAVGIDTRSAAEKAEA